MSDEPLRIIDIDENNGRSYFKLADELDKILEQAGEHEICLIATTGASRLGKSCFLSYLIRYLHHLEKGPMSSKSDWLPKQSEEKVLAFPYANTLERQTTGFWIWPRPFLLPGEKGRKIAVFVMDTQGVFDEKSMTEWSAIVGVALLTSSILIYNLPFNPSEEALISLDTFLEYGRMLRDRKADDDDNDDEIDPFPFQKLFCLIRDWNPKGTHAYGMIGGKQFIEKWLAHDNPTLPAENIKRRKNINSCFSSKQAWLLPGPGEKAKALQFRGATADLEDEFYTQLKAVIEELCRPKNLVIKKLAGRTIYHSGLTALFQNVVKVLNSSNTPRPIGFLEATYEASCENARRAVLHDFEASANKIINDKSQGYTSMSKLIPQIEQLEKKAISQFLLHKKIANQDIIKNYKKKLLEDMEAIKSNIRQQIPDAAQVLQSLKDEVKSKFGYEVEEYHKIHNIDQDMPIPHAVLDSVLKQICNSVIESFDTHPALEDDDLLDKFESGLKETLSVLKATCKSNNKRKEDGISGIIEKTTTNLVETFKEDMTDATSGLPFLDPERLQNFRTKYENAVMKKLQDLPETKLAAKMKPRAQSKLTEAIQTTFNLMDQSNLKAIKKAKTDLTDLIGSLVVNFEQHMQSFITHAGSMPKEDQLQFQSKMLKSQATEDFMAQLPIGDMTFCNPFKITLIQKLNQSYSKIVSDHAENEKTTKAHVDAWLEKQFTLFKTKINERDNTETLEPNQFKEMCKQIVKQLLQETKDKLTILRVPPSNQEVAITDLEPKLNSLSETLLEGHEQTVKQTTNDARMDIGRHVHRYTQLMTPNKNTPTEKNDPRASVLIIQNEFKTTWSKLPPTQIRVLLSELDQAIGKSEKIRLDQQHQESAKIAEAINTGIEKFKLDYQNKMSNQWRLEYVEEKDLQSYSQTCKDIVVQEFLSEFGQMRDIQSAKLRLLDEIDNQFQEDIIAFRRNKQSTRDNNIKKILLSSVEKYKSKMDKHLKGVIGDLTWLQNCHEESTSQILQSLRNSLNTPGITLTPDEIQTLEEAIQNQIKRCYQGCVQQLNATLASLEEQLNVYEISCAQEHESEVRQVADALIVMDNEILDAKHKEFSERTLDDIKVKFAVISKHKLANSMQKVSTGLNNNLAKVMENYSKKFEKFAAIMKDLDTGIKKAVTEADDPDWSEISAQHDTRVKNRIEELVKLCNFPEQRLMTDFRNQYESEAKMTLDKNRKEFVANQPDPAVFTAALRTFCEDYEREMNTHIHNPTTYVDPNQLKMWHNQASQHVLDTFKQRRIIPMTALVKAKLRLKVMALLKIRNENNFKLAPTQEAAIGIDLGTTYCCVAIYEAGGHGRVLENAQGDKTTPSYIRVEVEDTPWRILPFHSLGAPSDPPKSVVGASAKKEAYLHPSKTIFDAKRLIGRQFNDQVVQRDIQNWPFSVVSDSSGKPVVEIEGVHYAPQAISAKLLSKLKKDAETKCGRTITSAVITVPANFNNVQRQDTKDAGVAAGLQVLELLNEPTAAALAYSLQCSVEEEKRVLVFDFGGGTFDIAILTINDGAVEVLTSGGDTHLGGEDIDNILMEHCIAKFTLANPTVDARHGQNSHDNLHKQDYSRRIRRLRNACEDAKKLLSTTVTTKVTVEVFYRDDTAGLDLAIDVSRTEFDAMNDSLYKKCIQIVEDLLFKEKITKTSIDEIVLVGGSTRIPKIREMLSAFFGGKALNNKLNADEAVAQGASIRAASLHGYNSVKSTLQDVTAMSIGIRVEGGGFSSIFPRNSKYPAKLTKMYRPSHDDQTEVDIAVYEGEDDTAARNNSLGTFILTGIPLGPADQQRINVTIGIDSSEIITITATCEGNGATKALTIGRKIEEVSSESVERLPPPQRGAR